MKRIKNIGAPAILTSVLTPADASLSIIQVDGRPLTQAEDAAKGIWTPDRSIDPLILDPVMEILDQETQQKVTTNIQYHWYLDEVKDWDNTTKTGLIPTSFTRNDGYYYETPANPKRLIVTANIHYEKTSSNRGPVNIICVATSNSTKYGQLSDTKNVLLTSSNIPDALYTVQLEVPNVLSWHPFDREDPVKQLSAVVHKGKEKLSAEQMAELTFFWYVNGTLDPSKRTSTSITYNAAELGEGKVTLKIASYRNAQSPDVLSEASVSIVWYIPPMDITPYSAAGCVVKSTEGYKEFSATVKINGFDVDEDLIKEYMQFRWSTVPVKQDTSIKYQGFGRNVLIKNADLYPSTASGVVDDVEVRVVAYILGVPVPVTCSSELVRCNGELVTCRE